MEDNSIKIYCIKIKTMVAAKEYPNRKEKNIGVVKENLLYSGKFLWL
jgi:hypothetical protein